MKLTSVSLNQPCRSCGSYDFRTEADRRDTSPVVCAHCGQCAGQWGKLRSNGLSGTSEDYGALLSGMIGRSLSRRTR
jgi:hypothetical protein